MLKIKISLFLKGLAMGAVNKIPGVSGGTVAFVTGIYEDLLNSIKKINFNAFKILFTKGFKAFYEEINGKFLTIVFSGVIASFFSVSLILDSLIEKYELYVFGLFFGMIVGSFYVIYFQLERITSKSLIGIIIGVVSGLLISFDKKIKPKIEPSVNNIRTFNKYSLSGSLINVKSNDTDSIRVKYKAFTESTIINV